MQVLAKDYNTRRDKTLGALSYLHDRYPAEVVACCKDLGPDYEELLSPVASARNRYARPSPHAEERRLSTGFC